MLNIFKQECEQLDIPESVKQTFIDHYNNRDTWLCCCEVTKRIYGDDYTQQDQKNVIKSIKKLDNDDFEQGDQVTLFDSRKKSQLYLISYDGFKEICMKANRNLHKYYIKLERVLFDSLKRYTDLQTKELTKLKEAKQKTGYVYEYNFEECDHKYVGETNQTTLK